MNRKKLAIAVAGTFFGSAFFMADVYAAEQTAGAKGDALDSYHIEDVVVTGDRDTMPGGLIGRQARVGVLGEKSVMEIPWSEMSMTERMIENYNDPSQPLANFLLNNPSIRTSTSSPMYTDFSMRGVNMNGNHMMLNGVPSLFYQFSSPPAHIIERMDITSGPNAAVNGVSMSNNGTNGGATPAPGTINVISKRAKAQPITRYTQVFTGNSTFGEYIDIGRRWGENDAWGLRVNAEFLQGEMSLKDAEKNSANLFFNLDHQGRKSQTNLFAGYWDLRVNGAQRWFTYTGLTDKLPQVPDASHSYDYAGTTKWMYGEILTLNHAQTFDDTWSLFFNGGFSRRAGNKWNSSASLKFDAKGNFVGNTAQCMEESGLNSYLQLGLTAKATTGAVKHDISLAVDQAWSRYWSSNNSGPADLYGGNLYDGIVFKSGFFLPKLIKESPKWEETNIGITLADAMTFGKWNVLLAASQKREEFTNFANKTVIRNNNILPTWGFTYRPTNDVSIYYGHTESFSRGAVVTNSGSKKYVNNGDTLEPVRSRQDEIGVKYLGGSVLHTLGFFQIDEPNLIDIPAGAGFYRRAADGKNVYRGVEYTMNGNLAPKWTVTGGLLYLDAKRDKTVNGAKDGLFVTGAARWSGVLGLEYRPDKDFSILGRLVMTEKCFIENTSGRGKIELPGYATFDLGVKYSTRINTTPLKLSLMCYNVFNKSYWMGRGGSSTFGLSMPRTLMFSAQVDL
ncbi:MAG: TonB-dependent receptor [Schwartzia sp. (in: firmicutes)]